MASEPDIVAAAVIRVPDATWDERPCAVVVVRDGVVPDPDTLREWLIGKVARWWTPEYWSFVPEIPLTSVGKLDKKVLRQRRIAGTLPVVRLEAPLPHKQFGGSDEAPGGAQAAPEVTSRRRCRMSGISDEWPVRQRLRSSPSTGPGDRRLRPGRPLVRRFTAALSMCHGMKGYVV